MGMSASQARLIALTARMSDVEYEGQQINQQRLTLANQMTAIYSALAEMEVPTPPSKLDYKQKVYTGKNGGTDYKLIPDDNGKIHAYRTNHSADIVSAGTKASVGRTIDPGQYIDKTKPHTKDHFAELKASDYEYEVTEADNVATKWDGFGNGVDDKELCKGSYTISYKVTEQDKDGNDVQVAKTQTFNVTERTERSAIESEAAGNTPTGATDVNVTYNLSSIFVGTKPATSFESGKNYHNTKGGEDISGDDAIAHNTQAKSLQTKQFAVADGSSYKLISAEDAAKLDGECFEISDLTNFQKALQDIANGDTGITVGGNPVMSIDAAISKYSKDPSSSAAFTSALDGLKHSFPSPAKPGQSVTWEDFSVIVSDGGKSFSFCQTEDITNDSNGKGDGLTQVWTPGKGDYDEEIDIDPSSIKYDGSYVSSATVDGANVSFGIDSIFDEDAYLVAFQKYENEKAMYDDEQNKMNKTTSIYQREDKMLELKLKRLDTERNALNTEIDAVKKVIQDATDKGFKTFSG